MCNACCTQTGADISTTYTSKGGYRKEARTINFSVCRTASDYVALRGMACIRRALRITCTLVLVSTHLAITLYTLPKDTKYLLLHYNFHPDQEVAVDGNNQEESFMLQRTLRYSENNIRLSILPIFQDIKITFFVKSS